MSAPLGPLVLIVEDNAANLLLTRAVLRRAGYRTISASSAEEARAALQTEHPDLILMDLQLPGQDGLALTRELKADPRMAPIPVVALTAYAMKEDRARARAAGCDGYMSKPIDTRTFASELTTILATHRAEISSQG